MVGRLQGGREWLPGQIGGRKTRRDQGDSCACRTFPGVLSATHRPVNAAPVSDIAAGLGLFSPCILSCILLNQHGGKEAVGAVPVGREAEEGIGLVWEGDALPGQHLGGDGEA